MKKTLLLSLILFVVLGLKLNAQVSKLPFRELYLDGKLIYGDSIALSEKNLNIYYCDTNGLKIDSCKGLYFFKYKKFTWIVNATQYKDSNYYYKFVIESLKPKEWKHSIKHPKRKKSLSFYSSRSTAWYSKVIKVGEKSVFYLY
jgi:hypothetical protein